MYLGGVAPQGPSSQHLQSRLRTGEMLRAGPTPTWELRAAMIIGWRSASWVMVRDLAARLPAMVLPRWLLYRSNPIAIDDVVSALLAPLHRRDIPAGWYDLPGPESVTHRDLLRRVAGQMGNHPRFVHVPVLTPRLSSYWIALVTRVDLHLARELVQGLQSDLEPRAGRSLWRLLPDREPIPLDAAIRAALADERCPETPSPATRARLADIGAYARERGEGGERTP